MVLGKGSLMRRRMPLCAVLGVTLFRPTLPDIVRTLALTSLQVLVAAIPMIAWLNIGAADLISISAGLLGATLSNQAGATLEAGGVRSLIIMVVFGTLFGSLAFALA